MIEAGMEPFPPLFALGKMLEQKPARDPFAVIAAAGRKPDQARWLQLEPSPEKSSEISNVWDKGSADSQVPKKRLRAKNKARKSYG